MSRAGRFPALVLDGPALGGLVLDGPALGGSALAHPKSVRGLRPGRKGSVFVFWNTGRDQLPITWDEAQRRLAEQAEREAQAT